MVMKRFKSNIFFLLLTLATLSVANAQSISRNVVASGGNFALNGYGSIHSSIGEVVVNSLFGSSEILTEGFVQPPNVNVLSVSSPTSSYVLSLYPNPVHDVLNIHVLNNDFGIAIEVFDFQGRLVLSSDEQRTAVEFNVSLNMSALDNGAYFVKITNIQSKLIVKTLKVVKI